MIYIIRHGQTDQNLLFRIQGQRDFPLNETGIKQAEDARDKLQSLGIKFSRIYSSPLSRALKTAEIVSGSSDITIEDRLKEMDYGPFEGADLKNLPSEMKVFFSDFKNNPAPDGVEQLPDLVKRLGSLLEDLKPGIEEIYDKDPEADILLSTHAIALKAAMEYLTPGSDGAYWSKYLPNCGIYRFDLKDGEYTVPEEFIYEIDNSIG